METIFSNRLNGRIVAVNENYICYAIKGNLIRCIHFVHVTRTKLDEHTSKLVDMEFADHSTDLLASLDEGGVLKIRRIYEEDNACLYETEIEVRLPVTNAQVLFFFFLTIVLLLFFLSFFSSFFVYFFEPCL